MTDPEEEVLLIVPAAWCCTPGRRHLLIGRQTGASHVEVPLDDRVAAIAPVGSVEESDGKE